MCLLSARGGRMHSLPWGGDKTAMRPFAKLLWTLVLWCSFSPPFSTSHLYFSLCWAGCCAQLSAVAISATVDSVLRIQRVPPVATVKLSGCSTQLLNPLRQCPLLQFQSTRLHEKRPCIRLETKLYHFQLLELRPSKCRLCKVPPWTRPFIASCRCSKFDTVSDEDILWQRAPLLLQIEPQEVISYS